MLLLSGRGLSLIQASGHPFKLPYDPVRTAIHEMAAAPGFRETLRAFEKRRSRTAPPSRCR